MAVDVQAASLGAGRSNNIDFGAGYVASPSYNYTPYDPNTVGSRKKLTVLTSTKSFSHASRVGSSPTSPRSYNKQNSLRTLRDIDTNMSSFAPTNTIPASTPRSDSRLAKLHKRASSGSSIPANPSPLSGTHSQFTTPFATYEEPFPDVSSTPPPSSTPKIKPYLRKMSSTRDDENQGRLDLSKSVSENGAFAGLGIQEFGARSVSDVSFAHTGRRTPHARATSTGSQISTGSGSFKPTQPFVHPMRQTPNAPYTPTDASSLNDDEVHESSDIVTDDDVQVGHSFRNRRSTSVSSTPQIQPTPLSRSYTPSDLGYVPKITNSSQTNLSIKSGRSMKSSKSKLGRSRRDTDRSDLAVTPSSRTSLDNAFSFVSRRSDLDPQTRDERIREERRKFEERQANKDRKMEKEAMKRREIEEVKSSKRQERQRRKSEVSQSERTKISKPDRRGSDGRKAKATDAKKQGDALRSRGFDNYRPGQITALPRHGRAGDMSEKESRRRQEHESNPSLSGWSRFMRMMSCGGTS